MYVFIKGYSYEDFIEGLRPNEDGSIKPQNGIFKSFCNKAEDKNDKIFYMVIDEINRGNISKIFDELITLIEESKRIYDKCNKYIKNKLGEDYMLGHSYFMGDNVDLEFIKEYKIKPFLEEYFYAEDKSADVILEEILQGNQ